jgi:hypothetical protein
LWRHGSWLGLAVALAFTVVLSFALVNTLIWTEWFSLMWRTAAWTGAGAIWLVGVAWTWRHESHAAARNTANNLPNPSSPTEDLFSAATREYLQGNWVAVHEKLAQLLAKNDNDIEARLLLASVYRRTDRVCEARAELHRLTKMEKAAAWQFEIDRELEMIGRTTAQEVAQSGERDTSDNADPQPTAPTCKAA